MAIAPLCNTRNAPLSGVVSGMAQDKRASALENQTSAL
jgi:hypothetical protein